MSGSIKSIKDISVLVVGLGSMGKRRVRDLKALGVGRVLGLDKRADRCTEASELLSAEIVDDLAQAVQRGINALAICTPPDRHQELRLWALSSGLHHFCEADIWIPGAAQMERQAAAKGLIAAPSCSMRFHPLVVALREQRKQMAGKLLSFDHRCSGPLSGWHPYEGYEFYAARAKTAAAREMLSFEMGWLEWIVGPVARLTAQRGKLGETPAEGEDTWHVLLETEDGAFGVITEDTIAPVETRSGRLSSQQEEIRYNLLEGYLDVLSDQNHRQARITGINTFEGIYFSEMKAFVAALLGEAAWPHGYIEAARATAALAAAERAVRESRWVEVDYNRQPADIVLDSPPKVSD